MTAVNPLTLVDTNVLVYAVHPHEPRHAASRKLIDGAKRPDAGLCVAPQNIAEFYATVTNPRRVTQPKSPADAIEAVEALLAMPGLVLLSAPIDVVNTLLHLLRANPVAAQEVFDAQLVAVMLCNGVTAISTFNDSDFRKFPGITISHPPA